METENEMVEVLPASAEVVIINRQAKATSLAIAKAFDKNHRDVLKSIRNLECSEEFTERNFAPSEYTDPTGRKLPMYELTRDGAVFLIMGYTGKEAARFKEAYINAFNRMEAELYEIRKEGFEVGLDYARTLRGKSVQSRSTAITHDTSGDYEKQAKILLDWMNNPFELINSDKTIVTYTAEGNIVFTMRQLQRYSPLRIKKPQMLEVLQQLVEKDKVGRLIGSRSNVYMFEFFKNIKPHANLHRIK